MFHASKGFHIAEDIDALKHLVRKYPQEAMECLTYDQMLEYIQSHNNLVWIWNEETQQGRIVRKNEV